MWPFAKLKTPAFCWQTHKFLDTCATYFTVSTCFEKWLIFKLLCVQHIFAFDNNVADIAATIILVLVLQQLQKRHKRSMFWNWSLYRLSTIVFCLKTVLIFLDKKMTRRFLLPPFFFPIHNTVLECISWFFRSSFIRKISNTFKKYCGQISVA